MIAYLIANYIALGITRQIFLLKYIFIYVIKIIIFYCYKIHYNSMLIFK